MPRPALTEAQRRETRRSIRQAAAKLYAENGFADISARKVAESAGVSVGTLYSYFDNLTELMQSLWKEPVTRLLADLETTLADIDCPLDRLRRLLQMYADFAVEESTTYRGAFLFVRPQALKQPTPVALDQDRFFSLLMNTVVAAQSEGLIRAGNPQTLAQTLWSGVHGAIALPTNIDRLALDPPAEALPVMIDALLSWLQTTD